MKTITYDLKQMQQTICANMGIVDKHDCRDLHAEILAKLLTKELGFYVGKNISQESGRWSGCAMNRDAIFDLENHSFDWNIARYKEWAKHNNLKHQDWVKVMNNYTVFEWHNLRPNKDKPGGEEWYISRPTSQQAFIHLLQLVTTGQQDEDYTLINKFVDDLDDKFNFTFNGVHVRMYKNGRLTLKGMTDEQTHRLLTMYHTWDNIRHFGRKPSDRKDSGSHHYISTICEVQQ